MTLPSIPVAASVATGLRWGGPRHGAALEITDGGVAQGERLSRS
ncbi:MAG: hypothetical protein ABSF28_26665 [Terracidiphilus sp.]|jgi:hypothetical protein